ncbi:hypothetical protein VHE8714_01394 [Vibrio splendidus]|nr:hypothetical protein VHE8714_01394 [Vibrio splendidus]
MLMVIPLGLREVLLEFGWHPRFRWHTTATTKWQRMLFSWIVFRGLNFSVAFDELTMFVAPIRKTEQFFRIKLASFRRDQDGTVKVNPKSIPTMI